MSDAVNSGRLRSFIERIERLEEEKKQTADDIKEVYAEAQGDGFCAKTLRKLVAERKLDESERRERALLFATYAEALGMYADTPLGHAATERAVDTAVAKGGKAAKGGDGTEGGFKAKVGDRIHQALAKVGKPVPLTDEEKRKGVKAAFEQPNGTRMSIATNVPLGTA